MNGFVKLGGIAVVMALLLAMVPVAFAAVPTVSTSSATYNGGEDLIVSGTASPGQPVTIRVRNPSNTVVSQRVVVAGADGTFSLTVFTFPENPTTNFPAGTYTVQAITEDGSDSTTVTYTGVPPTPDTTPPEIAHTPVTVALSGEEITISATVTDDRAVASVTLYYRQIGEVGYKSLAMSPVGATYSATIPASDVVEPGLEYYIVALDTSSNEATSGTAENPNVITVTTPKVQVNTELTKLLSAEGAEITEVQAGSQAIVHAVVTNPLSEAKTVVVSVVVTSPEGEMVSPSAQFKLTIPASSNLELELSYYFPSAGDYALQINVLSDYVRLGGTVQDSYSSTISVVGGS